MSFKINFILILGILIFTSCSKDFTCTCNWSENNEDITLSLELVAATTKNAKKQCNSLKGGRTVGTTPDNQALLTDVPENANCSLE